MKMLLQLIPLIAFVAGEPGIVNEQFPVISKETTQPAPLTLDAIPILGFGTWNLKVNTSETVSWAIQQGYRHIDCAAAYGNEQMVGRGIADGLAVTGLHREDLWITSKLWNDHHDINRVEAAIDDTLEKLGVDYLDLYHMHWPVKDGWFGRHYIDYIDTWGAMALLKEKGKARHIGVSNFSPHQMKHLLNNTSVVPAVHQMELHPYLQQSDWVEWHQKHNIHVTAYSPLAGSNPTYDQGNLTQLLDNSVVTKIAKKRSCTPAQVALAWGMSRKTSVIPKTSHFERVTENLKSLECILKGKDLKKLDDLGKAHHRYNNPSKGWKVELYEDLEDSKGQGKKHS